VDEELGLLPVAQEIEDDGLADAMDALDAAAGEGLGDEFGGRLEGLGLVGEARAWGLDYAVWR